MRERLVRPLQTLSNVLSGLREGDYSFQARGAAEDDSFGEVLLEVNALVATMREHRLGALEATALLRTVMAEIDVAVFAFDGQERLRLVNRAGERLLAQPAERLLGRTAAELGLNECLAGEALRTVQMRFPGGAGHWGLHRRQFRQGGLPHHLLVLSDLSRELREEERLAWQRLVRVLGHELNNSLAPIKSIVGSLERMVQRDPLPLDWKADMRDGLAVIAGRAEALNRFVGAYAQLAKLPKPKPRPVPVSALISRVCSLETRLPVTVVPSLDLAISADPDQLEQVLINLVRNAADATLEGHAQGLPRGAPDGQAAAPSGPRVGWAKSGDFVEIWVEDGGPGIANPANLFVPFFTTKPKGSGIGLVLCRQIAEAHGGVLTLENQAGARGCTARLCLPA
jgi:nitrogen fixation/metabolism regulation signal transduction histidine kinase